MYGEYAYKGGDGFPGAQSWLNVVETLGYLVYLAVVFGYGNSVPVKAVPDRKGMGQSAVVSGSGSDGDGHYDDAPNYWWTRRLRGRAAGWALLFGFGTSVATVAKTVLYCELTLSFFSGVGLLFSGRLWVSADLCLL